MQRKSYQDERCQLQRPIIANIASIWSEMPSLQIFDHDFNRYIDITSPLDVTDKCSLKIKEIVEQADVDFTFNKTVESREYLLPSSSTPLKLLKSKSKSKSNWWLPYTIPESTFSTSLKRCLNEEKPLDKSMRTALWLSIYSDVTQYSYVLTGKYKPIIDSLILKYP